ncbi:MAG TPA: hypothetical protein VM536_10370 [Chloroflexia bacterium]|nr:hypothetical protein [Chloroflexia bacterium]
MDDIFKRLNNPTPAQPPEDGLSTLRLVDLPPVPRRIVRLMLRTSEMTHAELREAVAELPADERISDAQLEEHLDALCLQRWVIQTGSGEATTYKVNLQRKAAKRGMSAIYDTLDFEFKPPRTPLNPKDFEI